MNTPTKRTAIVALLVTFAAGAVAGSAISRTWRRPERASPRHTGDMGDRLVRHFTDCLKLRPEQTNLVDPIIVDAARRMREVHLETTRRSREVMDETDKKLIPLLDPAQCSRLAEMRRRVEKRLPSGPPPGHFPGPPPSDRPPVDRSR